MTMYMGGCRRLTTRLAEVTRPTISVDTSKGRLSMPYTIAVLGLGYVGATSMACLAKLGHRVIGVDVNEDKVALVNRGESPIHEPGISELMRSGLDAELVSATLDAEAAIAQSDFCAISVGTPSRPSGSVDTTFLTQVIETVAEVRRETGRCIPVFVRSTGLPAVHRELIALLDDRLSRTQPTAYCVHPEFMREGQAVHDFFHPPKIVYGCSDGAAKRFTGDLYPGIDAPTVHATPETAALVKYADNCFHALKVTFANEIGVLSHSFGVDARDVMDIFTLDTKLNISAKYLRPGMPYGGSCLPKDLSGVVTWARQSSISLPMIEHISQSNDAQIQQIIAQILQAGPGSIGFLGLAFKDNTDDLRESPMVAIVEHLIGKGRDVRVYDNNLVPGDLVGANRRFALETLPHLERILVSDCPSLVADCEMIVIARLGLDVDFSALPWRRDQSVFDFVGLPRDVRISAKIRGLYWPVESSAVAPLKAVS